MALIPDHFRDFTMALRNSKVFLAIAWSLVALSLASFVLRVILMVSKGHGGDGYQSGRGIPWTYSSVLVVAVAIVLVIGGVGWIWRRIRSRIQRRK